MSATLGSIAGTPLRSNRIISTTRARSSVRPMAASSAAPLSTNQVGVHALVFSGDWDPAGARQAIAGAAAAGYNLIEIPLLDPASVDAKMTCQLLEEHGIRASASMGLRLDADISSADADVAAAGEELLLSAVRCAAAMGVKHLGGPLYSAIAKYSSGPTREGRANAGRALRRAAAVAADLGVDLCLEVINRYESNLLNTAAQAQEFIAEDAQAPPNLLIHLDTYHMNIEEPGFAAAIATAGDRLAYVHIGESHRGPLGSGTIDFQEIFRALAAADYTGPITFESFSSRVVSPLLSDTLAVWRDLWEDSSELARDSREFIAVQSAAAAQYVKLQRARKA